MAAQPPRFDYVARQRHILLDMHVPDWDDGFLRRFDPVAQADRYVRAGADAVMVYANSMLGTSYWPSRVGRMHPALDGRDIVGETVQLLHDRGIAVCAYYSVNFNDLAHETDPRWRMDLATAFGPYGPESRFGLVCPASEGFRAFARSQVDELVSGYPFDAFFLDMMFWPGICCCVNCRDRYRAETGEKIPEHVDWTRPEWPRFAAARQRWLADQYEELAATVRVRRDIPVFDNSSVVLAGWRAGIGLPLLQANALVGGDVQAGPDERLTFGLLCSRLSRGPWQYMHSASGYLSGAANAVSLEEQHGHALLATALDGQFMTIDAVCSDGTVHDATYDRFAEVFAAMAPYAEHLGNTPTADVAVYYSADADIDLLDNGVPVADLPNRRGFLQFLPHGAATAGAVGALQRAHLPVGVITRADLDRLDDFRVVVLPNVLRMDDTEAAAFQAYVRHGGHLYASGWTSLVATRGEQLPDFALADLFGCSFDGIEPAVVSYVKAGAELLPLVAPAALVPHGTTRPIPHGTETGLTSLRVTAAPGARVLATLTRPYGLGRGTRADRAWSSILTSPPWTDTDHPTVVEQDTDRGRVVYSTCDIEAGGARSATAEQLFVGLIRRLLGGPARCEADTAPNVWVMPYDEDEHDRIRVNVLNHQPGGPYLPVPSVKISLAAPTGRSFVEVVRLPGGESIPFARDDDGRIGVELRDVDQFAMIAARYE